MLAIEAVAAAQALEFLRPLLTSQRLRQALALVREVSPPVERDRSLAAEFAKVAEVIAGGGLGAALE